MGPGGVNPRFERRNRAAQRVDGQRGDDVGGAGQTGRGVHGQRQHGRRGLGAVDQRQSFLGRRPYRREAGCAQRLAGGPPGRAVPHVAFADQGQGDVRERRQVAAGPDRAAARHVGMDAGVEQREQRLERLDADARVALGQHVGAQRHRRAHRAHRQRLADAGGVAAHQVHLQGVEVGAVDARLRERPEAGVDAVDRRVAVGRAIDDGAGRDDRRARLCAERDRCAVGHGDDRFERSVRPSSTIIRAAYQLPQRRVAPGARARRTQADCVRRTDGPLPVGRRRRLGWPSHEHRRVGRPVGRRRQGQDRRSADPAFLDRRPLPGRSQRRPHGLRPRPEVRPAPDSVGDPAPGCHLRDRQRRRGRSGGALRRGGRTQGPRHRSRGPAADQRSRPSDPAVPPRARRAQRSAARRAQDRHHLARHRAGLRGQDRPPRRPAVRPERCAGAGRRGRSTTFTPATRSSRTPTSTGGRSTTRCWRTASGCGRGPPTCPCTCTRR